MKQYRLGYTQGVFDMFHIGHLNLLNHAKDCCERLIVGVNSDELVRGYKHKAPVIPEEERRLIVESIKAVDSAYLVHTLDKVELLRQFHFDAVFIGDDWKGHPRWEATEQALAQFGVDVIYLPHTKGVSSTSMRPFAASFVDESNDRGGIG